MTLKYHHDKHHAKKQPCVCVCVCVWKIKHRIFKNKDILFVLRVTSNDAIHHCDPISQTMNSASRNQGFLIIEMKREMKRETE